MFAELSRRACLGALAGTALGFLPAASAVAHGRLPVGGRVSVRIPWSLDAIDPHRSDDALAAFLGDALFDTLYVRDEQGNFAPSLAEGEPVAQPHGHLRVTLRQGLRTAAGVWLQPRDFVSSLARSRALGARAWLVGLAPPHVDGASALLFAERDPQLLMRLLASPLTGIVPARFSREYPDGTGPFRAERRGDGLYLRRNPRAARGPAFLEEVAVRSAPDLASSLRSFESGKDDIGWLGSGLHDPRAGSRPFDAGAVGWVVLRTGRDAAAWDAPGVAQRLADGISPSRLGYLGLGPPWPSSEEQGWGGPPAELLVREGSPYLLEVATAVAATLGRPDHGVVVHAVAQSELEARRSARSYALALDVVRPLLHGSYGALIALASADDAGAAAALVRRPPKLGDVAARTLTRSLRLGVVGELRMQGARISELSLPVAPAGSGIDFGAATRGHRS